MRIFRWIRRDPLNQNHSSVQPALLEFKPSILERQPRLPLGGYWLPIPSPIINIFFSEGETHSKYTFHISQSLKRCQLERRQLHHKSLGTLGDAQLFQDIWVFYGYKILGSKHHFCQFNVLSFFPLHYWTSTILKTQKGRSISCKSGWSSFII